MTHSEKKAAAAAAAAKGNQSTDVTNKESLTANVVFRDLQLPNKEVNYKADVNQTHADMKQVFKKAIYVVKNASNDVFKLAPSHVAICEAIMLDNDLQLKFIDNVRKSDNGTTNMYFIRQLLYKIDKLGFDKAIADMQSKAAKNVDKLAIRIATSRLKKCQKAYDKLEVVQSLNRANVMLNEKLTKAARETYIAMRDTAAAAAAATNEYKVLLSAKEAYNLLTAKEA